MMTSTKLAVSIDQLSFFSGLLILRGSASNIGRQISSVYVEIGDFGCATLYNHPAKDQFYFHGMIPFSDHNNFRQPRLVISYEDGNQERLDDIVGPGICAEPGHQLFGKFLQRVNAMPRGAALEIGSRARSGITRRALIPSGWEYVGFDIVQGENVDVVGDAHTMSRQLPNGHFNVTMSFSVFEHLAMPWKVVLEMNKVMAPNGVAFIQTHQSWPLHETPWDFWRFSDSTWAALFNPATGFRIIDAASSEPLMMVAQRWHPIVNYGQAGGFALSAVLVEKVGETSLEWDVDLSGIVVGDYPY
jgi:hypothetical protein